MIKKIKRMFKIAALGLTINLFSIMNLKAMESTQPSNPINRINTNSNNNSGDETLNSGEKIKKLMKKYQRTVRKILKEIYLPAVEKLKLNSEEKKAIEELKQVFLTIRNHNDMDEKFIENSYREENKNDKNLQSDLSQRVINYCGDLLLSKKECRRAIGALNKLENIFNTKINRVFGNYTAREDGEEYGQYIRLNNIINVFDPRHELNDWFRKWK